MAGQGGTDLLVAQHRMLAKFLFGPEGWPYVSVVARSVNSLGARAALRPDIVVLEFGKSQGSEFQEGRRSPTFQERSHGVRLYQERTWPCQMGPPYHYLCVATFP